VSENALPRVVLDSNVFVSGVIKEHGVAAEVLDSWNAAAFIVLMSPWQRREIEDVLRRSWLSRKYNVAEDTVARLLHLIDERAEQLPDASAPAMLVRDPDDVPILAAALAGQADYLVTGTRTCSHSRTSRASRRCASSRSASC
jgi:uncharacterized protein